VFFSCFSVVFKSWCEALKNKEGGPLYTKEEVDKYVEEFPRQLSTKAIDMCPRGVHLAVHQARLRGLNVKEARALYEQAQAARRAAKRVASGGPEASPPKEMPKRTKRGAPGTVLQPRKSRSKSRGTESNETQTPTDQASGTQPPVHQAGGHGTHSPAHQASGSQGTPPAPQPGSRQQPGSETTPRSRRPLTEIPVGSSPLWASRKPHHSSILNSFSDENTGDVSN